MNQLNSWSFSRLQIFESCPHHAYLKFIEKIPDPKPRTAADRGTAIHQNGEDFVRGKTNHATGFESFMDEMHQLRSLYNCNEAILEEEWGFDKEWQPSEWKTAWLRIKCDAVVHLDPQTIVIIDYKTGKKFGNEIKHGEQAAIYAAACFQRNPKCETVITEWWYLDQDEITSNKFTRSKGLQLLARFNKRGLAITEETQFAPNPNQHSCKYCPYKPSETGHCSVGI